MDSINFSKTSLPPIVRVTSSGDAPLHVDFLTAPVEARKTIHIIEVTPAPIETTLVSPPEVGSAIKLRRRRRRRK
jgi:hypothetical protein